MAAHVLVPLCYGCLDESRSTVVSQTYEEHRDLFDCTLCVAVAAVLNVAANIINREVIAPHVPEHLSGIPLLCWSILIAIAMVCFAWSGPGLVYIMEVGGGAPSPHALECPALQPVHRNGNTIANKGCVCVSACQPLLTTTNMRMGMYIVWIALYFVSCRFFVQSRQHIPPLSVLS